MCIVRRLRVVALVSVIVSVIGLLGWMTWEAASFDPKEPGTYGFGREAGEEEIRPWDIDVGPDGTGLPPGRGTVEEGAAVYRDQCARCHGPRGGGGSAIPLVGGQGTLDADRPVRSVGSYWPYATTLYDYIYRAMPPTAPQSLTPDEVYALVAWILFQNGIIERDEVMNARTLPDVRMPNRDGFLPDPRPDVPSRSGF